MVYLHGIALEEEKEEEERREERRNGWDKIEPFFSNQNGEAKRERVARMRRARSMPKMDDQEVIHNGNSISMSMSMAVIR